MNSGSLAKKLETNERKILSNVLSSIRKNSEYKRRHYQELYTWMEKIRKRIFCYMVTNESSETDQPNLHLFLWQKEPKEPGSPKMVSHVGIDLQKTGN